VIDTRAARAEDSEAIARFICMAGDGLYEFLFDDLIPFVTAVDFLAAGVAGEGYPISYRHCRVAVDGERVVGAANVFPADWLREERYALLPAERQEHVRAMMQLQDWGSMFLNSLAVSEACRGQGVGARLLDWACAQARAQGFDRLSLHVWADNTPAIAFYAARGFVRLGLAEVAAHARLAHAGGSLLMGKALAG
jgi:ribosomal protein S18 acetylase RimI-like enzyme